MSTETENIIEMLGTSCISCNITTYVSIIETDGLKTNIYTVYTWHMNNEDFRYLQHELYE